MRSPVGRWSSVFVLLALTAICGHVAASRKPQRRRKILVSAPEWAVSHLNFQVAIADALADAGHEVHILTYSLDAAMENMTNSRKATKIFRHHRPPHKLDAMRQTRVFVDQFRGAFNLPLSGWWHDLTAMLCDICPELLSDSSLLAALTAEHYDMAIAEAYEPCTFAVFNRVGVRTTAASQALGVNAQIARTVGLLTPSSYVPSMWLHTFDGKPLRMSFMDRTANTIMDAIDYIFLHAFAADLQQPMLNAVFGGAPAPSLAATMRNVSLALVNNDAWFTPTRPLSTKVIPIGGINQRSTTQADFQLPPLDDVFQHLAAVVESAKNGVILMSFGTFAATSTMDQALVDVFLDTFAQFPDYVVLWKFNHTLLSDGHRRLPANVYAFDWLPQIAVLAHPKTCAFISHCGMNSVNEAARFGVPIVGIPLFAEQPLHAATIERFGVGRRVDVQTLRAKGSQPLVDALCQVFSDKRYADASSRLKQRLEAAPQLPAERLAHWVEFATGVVRPDRLSERMNLPEDRGPIDWPIRYGLDLLVVLIALIAAIS